ncbi:LOW QUALITY PROTEIN: hypothetical protein V2J09_017904 [Rumex salicifolius]
MHCQVTLASRRGVIDVMQTLRREVVAMAPWWREKSIPLGSKAGSFGCGNGVESGIEWILVTNQVFTLIGVCHRGQPTPLRSGLGQSHHGFVLKEDGFGVGNHIGRVDRRRHQGLVATACGARLLRHRKATAGLLINLERRGLFEVFSNKERNRWKEWQPRALVISSLVLQIALILSGGKCRKYSGIIWFWFFVWSTYLLAHWVATLALGVIANCLGGTHGSSTPNEEEILMWFRAPFLLVHLSGPDTITAYYMEDNELWQRHILELITRTLASLYISMIAWPKTPIASLYFPMLLVGVVKFGQRIGFLRSASNEHFRDSLLTPPDSEPNYAKFMEDFTLKKAEGFYVEADVIVDSSNQFQIFKHLFVDLILSFLDQDNSQSFFSELKSKKAFRVIEVELGFIYDVLYTKAPVVYSKLGCFLRLLQLFTMLLTLLKLLTVNKAVKTHLLVDYNGVSPDLKDLIFEHCLEISKEIKNSEHLMKLCRSRGEFFLGKRKLIELDWSTTKVEFDQNILLWHIATELCYYSDNDASDQSQERI